MSASAPTGVLTLVFTDVEGSSELSETYRAAFEPTRATHFRLLREEATSCNGFEVKTAGDSLFLVFANASEAVNWAIQAQRRLREFSWPALVSHSSAAEQEFVRPLVRIGMHTGEPFLGLDQGRPDYFGPPVNRAARVMGAGHGDQILVSNATWELAQAQLDDPVTFLDCGRHRLKGVGEERLRQVVVPGLPVEFPALSTLQPDRHNLPLPLTPIIGREPQIAEWRALLLGSKASPVRATRLLTLKGFGGMGKSRAALDLAEECVGAFADGVWWIGLEEVHSADEMFAGIARGLAIPLLAQSSVREQTLQFLGGRDCMLVLDNLEQIRDAAEVVQAILQSAPRVSQLVTTRNALQLRAERIVEVPPLPQADAERVFMDYARARRDDFERRPENAAAITELCRRLEGVPLAIELAASRITGMTPQEMLVRLKERFRLLQTKAPDLPPRQRALRAAIDWSYCLLQAEEQSLFAQLGAFVGGFTLDDVEAVCDAEDVFEGVQELTRRSLLRPETDAASQTTRYGMLESLREFACEKLAETADGGCDAMNRHAQHFRSLATKFRLSKRREQAQGFSRLAAETGNLRAALDRACAGGDRHIIAEIAYAVGKIKQRQGLLAEAAQGFDTGLEAVRAVTNPSTTLLVTLLWERAGIHLDSGHEAVAKALAQEALELASLSADAEGMANSENLLGMAALAEKDFTSSRLHFTQSQAQFARAGEPLGEAVGRNNLALIEMQDPGGDLELAARHFQSALALFSTSSDLSGMASVHNNLGAITFQTGNLPGARVHYAEALQLERTLGNRLGIARSLTNIGEVDVSEGELERAAKLFMAALILFEAAGSPEAAYVNEQFTPLAARLNLTAERQTELRLSLQHRTPDDLASLAIA